MIKLEFCPICRSSKIITDKQLIRLSTELEQIHWSYVNVYFSAYKYLSEGLYDNSEQFLTDLTLIEHDAIDPLDVLPGTYNISFIE
ncbi:MAG: hypothetical protein ACTSQA_09340 [Candidatus Heimdallarchaeaceae archaeon]